MRRAPWLVFALICACSGDDSHRHTKVPTPPPPTPTATSTDTPTTAGALSESTVQSYWTSPDEIEGAAKFALEDYAGAKAAFDKALAATKDPARIARLHLILGLCS